MAISRIRRVFAARIATAFSGGEIVMGKEVDLNEEAVDETGPCETILEDAPLIDVTDVGEPALSSLP
jgi:hypothetical protein